jgi:DNA-binding NtrC family response regulator
VTPHRPSIVDRIVVYSTDPVERERIAETVAGIGAAVEVAFSFENAAALLSTMRPRVFVLGVHAPAADHRALVAGLPAAVVPVCVHLLPDEAAGAEGPHVVSVSDDGIRVRSERLGDVVRLMMARPAIEPARHAGTGTAGRGAVLPALHPLIGASRAIRDVVARTRELHSAPCVLVTGESGTGKEPVARMVAAHGYRHAGVLVTVDCATLTGAWGEARLFGGTVEEPGAPAATVDGALDRARGGTLLLDEISHMPIAIQRRLADVLGGASGADAPRIVATTSRDLARLVMRGHFHAPLLARFDLAVVEVPPLRQHLEDIPALASLFTRQAAARLGKRAPRLTDGALEALRQHAWPGNVRELAHTIERAVILGEGPQITADALLLEAPRETVSA